MKKLLFAFCLPVYALAQPVVTYTETFDAPSEKWTESDNGKIKTVYKNGAYVMDAYEPGYMKFCGAEYFVDLNSDYTFETKLKFILGVRKSGYGLCWGYRSWNNYNVFYITNDGFAAVFSKNQEDLVRVMDWTEIKKKILKQETETNVLKVEKKGTDLYFYINGNKVFEAKEDRFAAAGKEHGIIMQNNMKISMDELNITCADKKINLVENPVNGFKLENLGAKINTGSSDRAPVISPDGKTIYMVSSREGGLGETDIWLSGFDNGEWAQSVNAGTPLNNAGHNFVISVTPDGNTLLVGNTYNADGSAKSSGVSISIKRDGVWSIPQEQRIAGYVNNNEYCSFLLTPDGTKLIMSIENAQSTGEKDFFISYLNADNTWTEPKHMGNVINSFGSDFSPFLAADGKTMFFASDGRPGYGSSDVYMTKRLDDTWLNWSEPKNLGPEINSARWEAYYCIPASGNYAYMVANGLEDGFGSDDVYRIKVSEEVKPDPVVMVKGTVYNKKTNAVIEADITYESLENSNNSGKAYSTLKDGFAIALPKGNLYGFQAAATGFIPVSENIDLKNLESYEEKKINLYLVPIEKGQVVRLNNIFFDFGKATLREESNSELQRLVNLLNENREMKIEIGGHTDNKGSDEFNKQLSDDRAKAVAEHLLQKGISRDRITSKGYGESKPVAGNETEEGMQLNRRVEFTIK